MTYVPAENRYESMQYKRCGESGLLLPAVSLGMWHNFGDTASYENMKQICFRAFDLGMRQGDRQAQSRMNRQRPVENGAAPAGVVTALDPAHLSRTQRQEIRRRVRCGESVTF